MTPPRTNKHGQFWSFQQFANVRELLTACESLGIDPSDIRTGGYMYGPNDYGADDDPVFYLPPTENPMTTLQQLLAHLNGFGGMPDLFETDLQDASLQGASLSNTNLLGADLRGADLQYANLQGADLQYADLSEANLRYANLQRADLRDADLRDADLRDVDLRDADLQDANLQGSNLQDAIVLVGNRRVEIQ